MNSELDLLLDMAARGKLAGAQDLAHMDGPAAAVNYIRIADLVASYNLQSPILDWGCGYGQVTWLLKRRGLDVISCDVEFRSALDTLPELSSQPIDHLSHPYLLPYDRGRFAAVLSVGVLEHVDNFDASLKR
jgi:2-polyprenyl-3-methyl-5-hydroxy-6-metoxy-1,4-benzoquinol methylase